MHLHLFLQANRRRSNHTTQFMIFMSLSIRVKPRCCELLRQELSFPFFHQVHEIFRSEVPDLPAWLDSLELLGNKLLRAGDGLDIRK